MSKFINDVTLMGYVGSEPRVTTLEGGVKVVQLSIGTTTGGYKKQDGSEVPEKTTWHTIVLWRKLAEVAEQYVKRGDRILVRGSLENRSWEKDGVKHYATDVVAYDMVLDNRRSEGGGKPAPTLADAPVTTPPMPQKEDELPF